MSDVRPDLCHGIGICSVSYTHLDVYKRQIVLTASYPAKRMGVKTGMAIWQAQQCCRDLIIVPPHYREYVRYSGFVREILGEYTDQIEPFGLDVYKRQPHRSA